MTASGNPMSGNVEPGQVLDVDVDQLAGMAAFLAVGRLDPVELGQPVSTSTGRTPRTVEYAMSSASPICGTRCRRSRAIVATTSSVVAYEITCGVEEGPRAVRHLSHAMEPVIEHVRSPTPPSSTTSPVASRTLVDLRDELASSPRRPMSLA